MSSIAYFRIIFPAAFILLQSFAFLLILRNALGGISSPFVPHLTLSSLLAASLYGLALISARTNSRLLAHASTLAIGTIATLCTTVFYLVATFCLYGFRDLPTRRVVTGYFTQLPAMIESLPFDRTTLIVACAAALSILILVILFVAWCFAGAIQISRSRRKPVIRPIIAATPAILLAVLLAVPPAGFITKLEPWLRSLYDIPLAGSGLALQENPVEKAQDQRIAADYPREPAGRRMNVVLVYIDGLRADVLQPYGASLQNMPFMTSLVSSGKLVQFPRVYATCSMTLCGLGSILQSRPAHRVIPGNFSLPWLLKIQGYQVNYFLSGDHQNFLALKQYYQPFDFYQDGLDLAPPSNTNDDVYVYNQLPVLSAQIRPDTPQFIMFGLMSVHIWGKREPRFRRWQPDKISTTDFGNLDQNSATAYRNNYMNGVLQADSVLQTIWQWLSKADYLDNSIVVITSDHGESLGENGQLGHARSLSTPELLTPLWIHDPTGQIRSRSFSSQEDIAPTIIDLLGLPIPSSWTGHSALQPALTERWAPLYYINSRDKFGLILYRNNRTFKYFVDKASRKESVFDLDRDLFEQQDISDKIPEEMLVDFQRVLRESFGTLLPHE